MIRPIGAALAGSLLALSACSSPAPQPAAAEPAPAAPPRPALTALPAAGCVPPPRGTVALRRGEIVQRSSLQLYYTGRDETYRTDPYVYMFESNATLINRNNSVRDSSIFGLWRGQTQIAQACGHSYRMSLVRATADSATISVRR